jgi:malonate decarboxylase beta subunit
VKSNLLAFIAKGVPAQHRSDKFDVYLPKLTGFDTTQQASRDVTQTLFKREDLA